MVSRSITANPFPFLSNKMFDNLVSLWKQSTDETWVQLSSTEG